MTKMSVDKNCVKKKKQMIQENNNTIINKLSKK